MKHAVSHLPRSAVGSETLDRSRRIEGLEVVINLYPRAVEARRGRLADTARQNQKAGNQER